MELNLSQPVDILLDTIFPAKRVKSSSASSVLPVLKTWEKGIYSIWLH